MPQDRATDRRLYRPSRRTVLKSGAGAATVLGAAPAAAAAQESDERPAAVDELFTALNCFERVAGTAEMALVVDFRREGIQQLREETDDEDDLELLRRAESHNEAAAREVRFGDQNAAQTQLERTTDVLAEVDGGGLFDDSVDELVNDLVMAQDEPFQIIFGEGAELLDTRIYDFNELVDAVGERVDFLDATITKLALRTVDFEGATLELSLNDISRISNPRTSRRIVLKTEKYLRQMGTAVEQLTTNEYTISFENLSRVTVSRGSTSHSTSIGLPSWLWATGYGMSRASINLVVGHLGLNTLLDALNPIPEATNIVLEAFADQASGLVGAGIRGAFELFVDDLVPGEAEDDDVTGRLDALIPFGLLVTHQLKAEVDTVEEFGEQLRIGDDSPAEELESLIGDLATVSTVVLPLETYTDVGGINFLTTPIEEFGEEINDLIEEATGVDISEVIGDMHDFGQSIFLLVLNSEMVGGLLPEEAIEYLSNQLGDS